jgi:hypothetical protein
MRIELLAGRGLRSFRVEAGNPMRCDLCSGCVPVRCERGVLSCDRHAPFGRERYGSIVFSMVFLGHLSTRRDHFGFIGGNMGLCAGRKRSRTENNGKPLHYAPKSRARVQRRANANCFDVDVRSSGTAAGKHIVPRLTESDTQGSQSNRGGTKVRRELLRHQSRDFMSVLSLSHIRRLRAQIVPLWSDGHTFQRSAVCEA